MAVSFFSLSVFGRILPFSSHLLGFFQVRLELLLEQKEQQQLALQLPLKQGQQQQQQQQQPPRSCFEQRDTTTTLPLVLQPRFHWPMGEELGILLIETEDTNQGSPGWSKTHNTIFFFLFVVMMIATPFVPFPSSSSATVFLSGEGTERTLAAAGCGGLGRRVRMAPRRRSLQAAAAANSPSLSSSKASFLCSVLLLFLAGLGRSRLAAESGTQLGDGGSSVSPIPPSPTVFTPSLCVLHLRSHDGPRTPFLSTQELLRLVVGPALSSVFLSLVDQARKNRRQIIDGQRNARNFPHLLIFTILFF